MKHIDKMTGFKATDANMRCKGHQFELGKWYEVDGELELCKNGFHFCVHPSGVWSYYNDSTTRVFKIEAEQVLDLPVEAGADFKLVAKRIRLVSEVLIGGDKNTGDSNTGYSNTGYWNTGDRNTGDSNTGNRNTGNSNTGNSNTGYWNTGDSNTGNWNTANFSSGHFCSKEPKVISFDKQTNLTRSQFEEKYPEAWVLGELLSKPEKINFSDFKRIPGITKLKLAALHKKHLAKGKYNL